MTMRLNTLQPAPGTKKAAKRVGRGIGSGSGKTCGKGHKGQKARSGCRSLIGFEGGQMPLQRRLPKFGFTSWAKRVTEALTLSDLSRIDADVIDMDVLRRMNVIRRRTRFVKIIKTGELSKAVTLRDLAVSTGAKEAIEAAGGKVE